MSAYYNENDKYCAQWLRNLIAAGLIAPGEVDDRDIQDVRTDDLVGFTQCHFFAGIGGWSYALRLAGWPDDRKVWTASCPCQPWANVNQFKAGAHDDRHLWPYLCELVRLNRPTDILGEQVASKDGLVWFSNVRADLERFDYAVGGGCFPAVVVRARHVRDRLYFGAHADGERLQRQRQSGHGESALEEITPRCAVTGAPVSHIADRDSPEHEPRPVPVAHDVPARVGRLRAYGNAIVPAAAKEFIQDYMSL